MTRSGRGTTPLRVYPLRMWEFCIAGAVVPVRVKMIKDTNESVQSNLVLVPEFPVGIISIVATLSIGAIIKAAKKMSFFQIGKMY